MQGISSQSLAGKLKHVESSRIFQIVVISIIILSAITIGAKTYDIPPLVSRALLAMDYAITYFFLAEILHNWTATFIQFNSLLTYRLAIGLSPKRQTQPVPEPATNQYTTEQPRLFSSIPCLPIGWPSGSHPSVKLNQCQNPPPTATDFRPVLQGHPAPKPYRRHPCLLRNPVPVGA